MITIFNIYCSSIFEVCLSCQLSLSCDIFKYHTNSFCFVFHMSVVKKLQVNFIWNILIQFFFCEHHKPVGFLHFKSGFAKFFILPPLELFELWLSKKTSKNQKLWWFLLIPKIQSMSLKNVRRNFCSLSYVFAVKSSQKKKQRVQRKKSHF